MSWRQRWAAELADTGIGLGPLLSIAFALLVIGASLTWWVRHRRDRRR